MYFMCTCKLANSVYTFMWIYQTTFKHALNREFAQIFRFPTHSPNISMKCYHNIFNQVHAIRAPQNAILPKHLFKRLKDNVWQAVDGINISFERNDNYYSCFTNDDCINHVERRRSNAILTLILKSAINFMHCSVSCHEPNVRFYIKHWNWNT